MTKKNKFITWTKLFSDCYINKKKIVYENLIIINNFFQLKAYFE